MFEPFKTWLSVGDKGEVRCQCETAVGGVVSLLLCTWGSFCCRSRRFLAGGAGRSREESEFLGLVKKLQG